MTCPSNLKTLQGEDLVHRNWSDVKVGQIVYLYATHESKEYGYGPFRVLDVKARRLVRTDSRRDFIHCPEHLYRLAS